MASTKQSGKVHCLIRIMLLNQCFGSVSMQIRIQVAKTIRIHADPDPSQTTTKPQKVEFLDLKYT
jgi:hypothetical protein